MGHIAWMSGGWPHWVSPDRGDEYEFEIIRFQAIMSFSQIGMNAMFGLISEAIRKKFHRPDQPDYGSAVSLFVFSLIFVRVIHMDF